MGLYYLIGMFYSLVMSVACYKIVENKGYTNLGTWALCGFLFGLIAMIVALAKPIAKQQNKITKFNTPADELLKYKELLDQEIITKEDFENKKKELI